ncbi:MAG: hypothetical protein U5L01_04580 [Rheinheimera sp.]|nr:hypothetical protein [Rheinheimera sp.]
MNYPAVLNVVFGSDFIEGQVNSEVIEVAPQTALVARVVEHQAPKTRTFDEVKAEVRDGLCCGKAQNWLSKTEKLATEELIVIKQSQSLSQPKS